MVCPFACTLPVATERPNTYGCPQALSGISRNTRPRTTGWIPSALAADDTFGSFAGASCRARRSPASSRPRRCAGRAGPHRAGRREAEIDAAGVEQAKAKEDDEREAILDVLEASPSSLANRHTSTPARPRRHGLLLCPRGERGAFVGRSTPMERLRAVYSGRWEARVYGAAIQPQTRITERDSA